MYIYSKLSAKKDINQAFTHWCIQIYLLLMQKHLAYQLGIR